MTQNNSAETTVDPSNNSAALGGGTSGYPEGRTSGGAGGHSISSSGPVEFSNMQWPGLQFPATTTQIQQALTTLPADQQQSWQAAIQELPADATYSSLDELQQACQSVSEKIAA